MEKIEKGSQHVEEKENIQKKWKRKVNEIDKKILHIYKNTVSIRVKKYPEIAGLLGVSTKCLMKKFQVETIDIFEEIVKKPAEKAKKIFEIVRPLFIKEESNFSESNYEDWMALMREREKVLQENLEKKAKKIDQQLKESMEKTEKLLQKKKEMKME